MSNIKLSRRKVISVLFFCGEQAAFQNNTFLSGYKEIKFVRLLINEYGKIKQAIVVSGIKNDLTDV